MKQFNPSATGKMSAWAQELKRQGIKIYDFAAGDPVLPNHPLILEAVCKALETKMSPYAPVAGLSELRLAASEWMNTRYKSSYRLENTLVTTGGKFGLYAAFQVLLSPGDEVLIPAPYWVSYPEMVHLAGGVPVPISTDPANQWKLTLADLKKHIRAQTKVLLLNNACNPTGALYSQEEIHAILELAHQAKLSVISDEVYSELVFDENPFISCASFPEYQDNVLVIESCSKNFAMAGWRVGFAFGPEALIQNMTALQSHSTTGAAWLSQKAALGALEGAKKVASYVKETLRERRDLFFKTYNTLFNAQEICPPAAIYFFAPIGKNSAKRCEEILTKAHVALVPGIAFGREGYARFAFSQNESEIVEGLKALADKTKNS